MQRRTAALTSIVCGPLALVALGLGACSGNGEELVPTAPPADYGTGGSSGDDGIGMDDSALYPDSQCVRVGDEVALTQVSDVQTVTLLWDTDHYLLAYADRSINGGDIMTLRLDPNGAPLGAPTPVGSLPNFSRVPNLTKLAAGGYLLAWDEGSKPAEPGADDEAAYAPSEAYVVVLDANGAPTGAPSLIGSSAGKETKPIVADTAEGPVVTWMEGDYDGGSSLSFVGRLDAAGALLPETVKQLGGAHTGFPHLATGPAGLGVVFSQAAMNGGEISATVEFGLLDASLTLTKPQSLRAPSRDARIARLSPRGTGFIAAWEDFRELDDEGYPYEQVFMTQIDQAGTKGADVLVENPRTGSANWPNIASREDGSASAVVYYQYRKARPQIFLALLDGAGNKIGGDLQVSEAPRSGPQAKYPSVQWSPANSTFGVSWIDTRNGNAQAYFAAISCP